MRRNINITPPAPGGPSAAAIEGPSPGGPSAAAIKDVPKRPKPKLEPPKRDVRLAGKRRVEQTKEMLTDGSLAQRKHQLQQLRLDIETQAAAASSSTFRVINADAASAADKDRRRGRSRDRARQASQRAPTPEYPVDMGSVTLPLL